MNNEQIIDNYLYDIKLMINNGSSSLKCTNNWDLIMAIIYFGLNHKEIYKKYSSNNIKYWEAILERKNKKRFFKGFSAGSLKKYYLLMNKIGILKFIRHIMPKKNEIINSKKRLLTLIKSECNEAKSYFYVPNLSESLVKKDLDSVYGYPFSDIDNNANDSYDKEVYDFDKFDLKIDLFDNFNSNCFP